MTRRRALLQKIKESEKESQGLDNESQEEF